MSITQILPLKVDDVVYPNFEDIPTANNALQYEWITTIISGLHSLFNDNPEILVAGDLSWYPVKDNNKLRQTPNVMVVFGRPKGQRGSYKQWLEDNLAPQVIFEVLSPNNTTAGMKDKFQFYQTYGVEEYYIYNPDSGELTGWLRSSDILQPISAMHGWHSPRLDVGFIVQNTHLCLYDPEGEVFVSYSQLSSEYKQARKDNQLSKKRFEIAEKRAEVAEKRAYEAEQHAKAETQARLEAETEIVRLKALLEKSVS